MYGDKARRAVRVLLNVLAFGSMFGVYFMLAGLMGISRVSNRILTAVAGSLMGWIAYRLFGRD